MERSYSIISARISYRRGGVMMGVKSPRQVQIEFQYVVKDGEEVLKDSIESISVNEKVLNDRAVKRGAAVWDDQDLVDELNAQKSISTAVIDDVV